MVTAKEGLGNAVLWLEGDRRSAASAYFTVESARAAKLAPRKATLPAACAGPPVATPLFPAALVTQLTKAAPVAA
jgi:hypothetical protein